MNMVIGIITKSPDFYVPKNVPCKIWLDKEGLISTAHSLEDGGGTFLNRWDALKTEFTIIN